MQELQIIDTTMAEILKRYPIDGPVCLVGSKDRDHTPEQIARGRRKWEKLPSPGFVGIDIEEGPNVDVVGDLCAKDFQVTHRQLCGTFGLVLCSALLEHVQDPFAAAQNIEALLKPGGHIYYVGPWVWGYHAYPDDLWRFSFSALKVLFPKISWIDWWYSSTTPGKGIRIDNIRNERKIFQEKDFAFKNGGGVITDRAMPYLNISAIGSRQ